MSLCNSKLNLKVRRSFEEAELEAMMAAEAQKRTAKETSQNIIGKSTQVHIRNQFHFYSALKIF